MEGASTIAALATPLAPAALAILRISGPLAFSVAKKCLDKEKEFEALAPRTLSLYCLHDNRGERIDHVSVIKYIHPHSYTGEDLVEVICHGAPYIIEKALEAFIDAGAVYAQRGEFTRRAFLNGKMDLARAESIQQIIGSRNDAQFRSAMNSYFGGYGPVLQQWRAQIEHIMVDVESQIEFGEEDDIAHGGKTQPLQRSIRALACGIRRELDMRKSTFAQEAGIRVAFIGPPNAGKSTVLNLVLGYERSIVFHEEGTTRDAVSEMVNWRGMDIRFIDSAGLRSTGSPVEALGVERSWNFVDTCEMIVMISAADEPVREQEMEAVARRGKQGGIIGIVNKADLAGVENKETFFKAKGIRSIALSAIDRQQREKVVAFLSEALENMRSDVEQQTIICTKRQEDVARRMLEVCEQMENTAAGHEEIVAYHGNRLLELLDEFAGKVAAEDILNRIFDEFCIGK